MKHRFIAKPSEFEKTELVWAYKGRPWMDAIGTGLVIAHDCIEHFADDTGRCEDELQALGAMFWTRQYVRNDTRFSLPETIASDLVAQYHHYAYDTMLLDCKSRYCAEIEDIHLSVEVAYKSNEYDESTLRKTNWDTKEQRRRLIAWMIRGYQRAKRRYPNKLVVGALFDNIRYRIPEPDYEGQELIIQYQNKRSEVKFTNSTEINYE